MTNENEITNFRELVNNLIDELYNTYEAENSLQNIAYIHPMFYNGTFCKDNCYQPPKPDELMSKDEFIEKMNNSSYDYRWNTALESLINYVIKTNNVF